MKVNKQRALFAAVLVAGLAWLLLLCNRGINMADEGVQVLYGYQVAGGAVTYLDYFVPVAPLGFLIQAGLTKLFGFHLIIGRLFAVLQGVFILLMALDLGRRYLRFPFSLAPGVLYIFFGAALGGFPHYNLDAAFFLFAGFYLSCLHMEKGSNWIIFAAGLLASCAACSKQSMAIPAAVVVALSVWMGRSKGRGLLRPALAGSFGLALPALLLFTRYATAHALEEAWSCLFGLMGMKRVVLFHILPPAAGVVFVSLVLVYTIIRTTKARPFIASLLLALSAAGAAVLILSLPGPFPETYVCALIALSLLLFTSPGKEHREFWRLARVTWALFFIFSVLSGLDLAHVLVASAGAPLLAGLFVQNSWEQGGRSLRSMGAVLLVVAMGVGAYLNLALPHISVLMQPRWESTARIDLDGLELIRAPPDKAREIERTVNWIKGHSAKDDKIFVYPWDLLLYVFSDRMPATYDTFFYFEIFDQKIAERVVKDLEREKPEIAVVSMTGDRFRHQAFAGQAGMIEGYLKSRYKKVVRFGDYQIMERRAEKSFSEREKP
ncbi:MAG: hypothetical protein R6V10_12880 [bacterium]